MQSFQDFLQSRKKKSADTDELQLLKRSRSLHASSPPHDLHSQLQQLSSSSKTLPGSLSNSFSYKAAAADAAAAAVAHTTTTVSGATPPSGGRYLSRSGTAACSRHKRSDGLTAALQQLISPQRSSGALSSSSSFRLGAAAAAAATAAGAATSTAGNQSHASPAAAAAAAAGSGLGELLASTSSRSAGLGVASASSLLRLQPLSVADTLQSPLSRSAVATPPGGRTPTGERTPVDSKRYHGAAAAFSASGPAGAATTAEGASSGGGGSLSAAVNNNSSSWSAERSATAVLQEAAARAAALHRSTTVKSQASQGDMPHAGLQAAASSQQLLSQQDSRQQQQQWVDLAQQQQQQQWRRQQEEQQEQQQQRESAAALLQDLDRRFASIKDSLKGVFSPQDSIKQRQQQQQEQQHHGSYAAAAAARGDGAAGSRGSQVSQGSPHKAVYQNSMTEPYTLDDDSSRSNSSSGGCTRSTSPTALPGVGSRSQQQQQQHQQLLTPSDSSSSDADSSEDEQPSSRVRQQHQHQHHHGVSQAAQQQQQQQQQQQHHKHALRGPAEPTLNGGIGSASSTQQQQRLQQPGKPAAIAAAAAAAAAATAAAADGSLPIEVDVKCGEEGELQGATAHFIVSNVPHHLLSPQSAAASGMGSSQQQQWQGRHHGQHHSARQQHPMGQEQFGKPSTHSMLLSAEPSGVSDAGGLGSVGTAGEYSRLGMEIQCSTDSLEYAGAPQPRSIKPKPSIPQKQHQQQQRQQYGLRDVRGPGGAAAAVAAAGRGVLDAAAGEHWCSNALILAKQQVQELQQQNDALVRVLERERQQHAKTRQQVSELKLDLREAHAEWEVKLQALRQERAAAEVQLRRALAGGDQQETFAAYDAALLASAARVEEAQSAASKLATQVAELELQVQQLQLICSTSAVGPNGSSGGALTSAQGGLKTARRRPLSGSSTVSSSSRADGAAVVRAVASAECRSPERRSPCRQGFAAGAAADGCGGRGVRALRQHQTHLEQQIAKLSEELTQLQRENVKLVRYKRQYEVAAQSLQASGGAKAAAEAFAEEAGLRAAAAIGRAEKLDMEVEALQQQLQQLKAERDRLQLHLDIAQQQQRLQASLSAGGSSSRSMAAPNSGSGSGYHMIHYTIPSSSSQFGGVSTSAALAGVSGSAAVQTALGNFGLSAGGVQEPGAAGAAASLPVPAAGSAGRQQQSATGAAQPIPASLMQAQQGVLPPHASTPAAAAGAAGGPAAAGFSSGGGYPTHGAYQGGGMTPSSMGQQVAASAHAAAAAAAAGAVDPGCMTSQPADSGADQEALYVVQQLKMALPDASPAHGQLASLMSAIQAGVQERQALAAQGKVLLDMLVGGS